MKPWLEELVHERPELAIAPLIDVVFLLLIYFLVTSSLKPVEADLSIKLPGTAKTKEAVKVPDEQIVEISPEGDVILNGRVFGNRNNSDLSDLVVMLMRYKENAEAGQNKAMVTIQADGDSAHQRSMDVLNACAAARVTHVSFGMGD